MAQSRLEKIGTIFTRVTGLLRSGAMKPEDKPIWYDVYKAFPPKLEPRYDRPIPNIPLRKIFYQEDNIRAKYHKISRPDTVNLFDSEHKTDTQEFIDIYNELKSQGALDEEKIIEVSKQMLDEKLQARRPLKKTESNMIDSEKYVIKKLSEEFSDSSKKTTATPVNINEIFKE